MILLAASLFFGQPLPLEMPRAEAYLLTLRAPQGTNVAYRLEDRFLPIDLWTTRAVVGRWYDDDNRIFTLARLEFEPPPVDGTVGQTRENYVRGLVRIDPKRQNHLVDAIETLSPVALADEPAKPHQLPRGYRDVRFWQGTNTAAIVCAYWPQKTNLWFLATWQLAEGDDFDERLAQFREQFLEERKGIPCPPPPPTAGDERALLRADAAHAVAAYPSWHVTDAKEFTVLDNLSARGFAETLTNELPRMRARYSAAMPSPVDGDVLCVARIFADRDDYLEASGLDKAWTAAYWCPWRRELVAYMPPAGPKELLKTIRHEAFHQYLSYATAMATASPWFNEGYAEYFEDETRETWTSSVADEDTLDTLTQGMPEFVKLDYRGFYAGSYRDKLLRYDMAWSMACFIEKGCPELRFQPFKDLKKNYLATLLETRDPQKATDAAFGSRDRLIRFMTEWKRFWHQKLSL